MIRLLEHLCGLPAELSAARTTSVGILAAAVLASWLAEAVAADTEADNAAYRRAQEAFVSDLTGTSMREIVLVSLPVPLGLWVLGELTAALQLLLGRRETTTTTERGRRRSDSEGDGASGTASEETCELPLPEVASFLLEFTVTVLPSVLTLACGDQDGGRWRRVFLLFLPMFLLGGACSVFVRTYRPSQSLSVSAPPPPVETLAIPCRGGGTTILSNEGNGTSGSRASSSRPAVVSKQVLIATWKRGTADSFSGPRPAFVTNFRAGLMVLTCIAILAVDFPAFPRRFAKTETFGSGLMDLGTGSIVFASGLVASKAEGERRASSRSADTSRSPPSGPGLVAVLQTWPLLVLGFSRLAMVKVLGYQEHVSEYGVHWNFFLTFLCVRVVTSCVLKATASTPGLRAPLALAALTAHQFALSVLGMTEYVLHADRVSLLSKNREGVLGLTGYCAIFFIAEDIGRRFLWQRPIHKSSSVLLSWRLRLLQLLGVDVMLWLLVMVCRTFVQPPSRRLMNLCYVLWCCAHCVLLVLLLGGAALCSSAPAAGRLYKSISDNQFTVFLLSNVATGAVNLSTRTLEHSDSAARGVLLLYMLAVCSASWALQAKGGKLKDSWTRAKGVD